MAKTLKKRGQRGIEPRTSRTLSENHTTRPLSLMKRYTNSNIKNRESINVSLILKRLSKFSVCGKNFKKRGQRGIEPRTSRTRSENHTTRPLSLMNSYTNSNIKNMECTNVSLILKGLSKFSVCGKNVKNKKEGQRGIEPRTSRTLSENHTTRPLSLMKRYTNSNIKTHGVYKFVVNFEKVI